MNMKYAITADLGGTTVKIGLFYQNELLDYMTYDATPALDFIAVMCRFKSNIHIILNRFDITVSEVDFIGLAMPGIVDDKNCIVRAINEKYSGAINFNFIEWFSSEMNLDVLIENDANAALLGEKSRGVLGDCQDAILFMLGTGVGTSVLSGGRIFKGAHGQGGCLGGHFSINPRGRKCNCGSVGCVEAEASTWALAGILKDHFNFKESSLSKIDSPKIKDLVLNIDKGDTLAIRVLEDFIYVWGAGIVNMIHAYDPEVVVLSGGVFNAADKIVIPLTKYVEEHAWTSWGKVQITLSLNPEQSALYGMNHIICEKRRLNEKNQ